ncbi:MAG TPA: alpha/beta hydrolase [Myxococcota bacterium]|nr:alpha/beta hydrolase [Myxococcota bacterium]
MKSDTTRVPKSAWKSCGGSGPLLHFAHANGIPCGSYSQFMQVLSKEFTVHSMEARPMWPDSKVIPVPAWEPLVQDLRLGLRERDMAGCIGVGHSLGAVCSMLASVREPGLFKALVLIDPVLFNGVRQHYWHLLQVAGLMDRIPLVKNAQRRRNYWPTVEDVRDSYMCKPFFRSWAPGCMDDYLKHGLTQDGSGYKLRYPPAWEAEIFKYTPANLWRQIAQVKVPTMILRGQTSDTLTKSAAKRAAESMANGATMDVPGTGHMLPVQQPQMVAKLVIDFLKSLDL